MELGMQGGSRVRKGVGIGDGVAIRVGPGD